MRIVASRQERIEQRVEAVARQRATTLCLVIFLASCGGQFAGRATPARSRVDEADGVRVLLDVSTRGPTGDHTPVDQAALDEITRAHGAPPIQPPVDFSTHVVIGATRWVDLCRSVIAGVEIDDHARIVPFAPARWYDVSIACAAGRTLQTTLLAIPRRILPRVGDEVVLDLEGLPPREIRLRIAPPLERTFDAREPAMPLPTEHRGVVDLPTRGWLALRTLDDGSDVWVVHHATGDVDVLAADAPRSAEGEVLGVWTPVSWVDWQPAFYVGHFDAYGTSHGSLLDPLDVHAHGPPIDGRIDVGERLPGRPRAFAAPAPFIEGGRDAPYADRAPVPFERLTEQPIGAFVVVAAELQIDRDGARLCPTPTEEAQRASAHDRDRLGIPARRPCGPASHPVYDVSLGPSLRDGVVWIGPTLVVRWRGDGVDHPILLGSDVGWTRR